MACVGQTSMHSRQVPQWCRYFGPPALVAVTVLVVRTPAGRGWAFNGGLPLFAILAVLIVGSIRRSVGGLPL